MIWRRAKTSSLRDMRRLLIMQVDERQGLPRQPELVRGDREPIKVSPDTMSETIRKPWREQEAEDDSHTTSMHTLERTGNAAVEPLQAVADVYEGRQKASEAYVCTPISKATQMSSLMQELAEMARCALNAVNAQCRTGQRTEWPKKK